MKKFLTLISTALLVISAWANTTNESDTVMIGTYHSDDKGTGVSLYNASGKDTVISATIIPSSEYKDLTDGKIVSVRFAMAAATKVKNVYVYNVTETGKFNILACVPMPDGQGKIGWNNVVLPTPLDLPKEGALALGYSYQEVAGRKAVSIKTDLNTDDGYVAYLKYNGNRGWYNLSDNGVLCMQAYVQTSMRPEFGIKLSSFKIAEKFLSTGQKCTTSFVAYNAGYGEVSSYKFEVKLGDKSLTTITEACGVKLSQSDATLPVEFTIPSDIASGSKTITIKATEVNGQAIIDGDEASATTNIFQASDLVKRQRLLIEECTSHSCTYCPYGAKVIEEIQTTHPGEVAVACLHGNQSSKDPFYTTEIGQMLSFLGCNSFPSAALNRTYQTSEGSLTTGLGYSNSTAGANAVYAALTADLTPSYATVDIETSKEGNTLSINVSGKGGQAAKEFLQDYSLTVYVLEDSLVAKQLNLGTWVAKYTHRHVVRKIATAINGDDINWTSNAAYSNDIKVELDTAWVVNHLSIVAFLSKKQPTSGIDYTDMAVNNANEVHLDANGIVSIQEIAIEAPAIEMLESKKIYQNGKFTVVSKGHSFDLLGR